MGMTMTQKILAAHAGLSEVKAGQLIEANLDLVLGNDITSPVAINEMKKMGNIKELFKKYTVLERVVLIILLGCFVGQFLWICYINLLDRKSVV